MKIRTIAVFVGLALLAIATAFAVPVMMTAAIFDPGPKAPTDQTMIAHWEKYRKTLDQITEMLRSDPALNRLGMDWSDPDDPARAHVPPERIADYRDLMREASIISISRGHRSVQFLFHSSGLSVSGFGKSFVRGEAIATCRSDRWRSRCGRGGPPEASSATSHRRWLAAAARRKLMCRSVAFTSDRGGFCRAGFYATCTSRQRDRPRDNDRPDRNWPRSRHYSVRGRGVVPALKTARATFSSGMVPNVFGWRKCSI